MLTHVFDPPPDHLAVPWGFLGLLYAVALAAGIARSGLADRAIGRLPLGRDTARAVIVAGDAILE